MLEQMIAVLKPYLDDFTVPDEVMEELRRLAAEPEVSDEIKIEVHEALSAVDVALPTGKPSGEFSNPINISPVSRLIDKLEELARQTTRR